MRSWRSCSNQTTSYTSLAVSVDYTDTEAQKKDAKMTALAAEIGSRLSFIESEIADAPEELIRAAMDKTGRAKHYLAEILREKPHRLSAETEKVLADSVRYSTRPTTYHDEARDMSSAPSP